MAASDSGFVTLLQLLLDSEDPIYGSEGTNRLGCSQALHKQRIDGPGRPNVVELEGARRRKFSIMGILSFYD
jgi:hypothetical protein